MNMLMKFPDATEFSASTQTQCKYIECLYVAVIFMNYSI